MTLIAQILPQAQLASRDLNAQQSAESSCDQVMATAMEDAAAWGEFSPQDYRDVLLGKWGETGAIVGGALPILSHSLRSHEIDAKSHFAQVEIVKIGALRYNVLPEYHELDPFKHHDAIRIYIPMFLRVLEFVIPPDHVNEDICGFVAAITNINVRYWPEELNLRYSEDHLREGVTAYASVRVFRDSSNLPYAKFLSGFASDRIPAGRSLIFPIDDGYVHHVRKLDHFDLEPVMPLSDFKTRVEAVLAEFED
jgi:hypothetical protein